MRKVILLGLIMVLSSGCNEEEQDEFWWEEKIVFWSPNFIIINSEEENLFKNNTYKESKLSLTATNENWETIYEYDKPMTDVEGIVEVLTVLKDENNEPFGMTLGFGYQYSKNENLVTSYYKLEYDDNKYDYIKTTVDISNNNFIITELFYNGVEYVPSEVPPVVIIKD